MWISEELAKRIDAWGQLASREQRHVCRELRRLGLSYGEIARVVAVPKGTLSAWVRDIALTPWQEESIRLRSSQKGRPRDTQRRRRQQVERVRRQAIETARILFRDPLWTMGLALYWGEGAKTTRRLEMSNADDRVLRSFMDWCIEYHDEDAEFVAALNLHHDNDVEAAHAFWGAALGLPLSSFNKPFIKPDGTGHRTNRLEQGVCRLIMRRSTDEWIATMTWIDLVADAVWPRPEAASTLVPGR